MSVLDDTLLANVQAQLDLSRARAAVGAATTLDVRRAEVQVGQARVALLRERNSVETEKLRLFQALGVEQPSDVRLTTELPVTQPNLNVDELLANARRQNPAIAAARSRENAANVTRPPGAVGISAHPATADGDQRLHEPGDRHHRTRSTASAAGERRAWRAASERIPFV